MSKILVLTTGDYADEFDIEGFACFDNLVEWENHKKEIQKIKFPHECYYGTNESVIIESYEDWLHYITVKEITDEEYNFLVITFGHSFGMNIIEL